MSNSRGSRIHLGLAALAASFISIYNNAATTFANVTGLGVALSYIAVSLVFLVVLGVVAVRNLLMKDGERAWIIRLFATIAFGLIILFTYGWFPGVPSSFGALIQSYPYYYSLAAMFVFWLIDEYAVTGKLFNL